MSSDRPTEEMFRENAQIISITTLTRATEPEREEWYRSNGPMKSNPSSPRSNVEEERKKRELREKQKSNRFVPRQVSTYRENNDVQIFTYSKAIQKSPEKKPANEFKHLWVVKTFIVAEETFPTTRRRLEVRDRKETMLSPIENAISTILNKNIELREKIEQVRLAPQGPVDVGPLSMNLNGMIDAAVNGGTQKYIEAFLTNEFLQENRDHQSQEQQKVLRQALKDQTEMLRSGLSVFGARCDVKLKGLFDHLSGFFDQMVTKMSSSGIL